MLKNSTLQIFLSLTFIFLITINLQGQSGCPGCIVDVPNGLAEDTIYLDPFPDGTVGAGYQEDISFRLPKTTTPVAATDSTVQSGIGLDEIKILYISNVPPGLQWETNAENYDPDSETDGCVKFCGTPLAPGTYLMDIVLEVKISFITQETSFKREIVILPSTSTNDGFDVVNSSGCGEITVEFENNIPSNGNSGYSYLWDFGNGNESTIENPAAQTYSEPGSYPVDYQVVIDTSGFLLTKVRVLSADCNDFFTPPDLYLDIIDPSGNSLVTPWLDDVGTPVEFILNLPLVEGNYTLLVKDEDGGLNGADDNCGTYNFNQFSDGLLINGSASVELTILHPVDTVRTTDTVYVYPNPDQPELLSPAVSTLCEGESAALNSSYATGNQWLLDGSPINGATESSWLVTESGNYSVVYTNEFGCSAVSEESEITFLPIPEIPIFNNSDNLLEVVIPGILPDDYSLQWYYENTLLPGENGLSYCLIQSGNVALVVTDNATGCTNTFTDDHTYDPDFVCGLSGVEDLVEGSLKIYPNPFQENLFIEFFIDEVSDFQVNIIDLLGRKIELDARENFSGEFNHSYQMDDLAMGVYILEIDLGSQQIHRRIILQE